MWSASYLFIFYNLIPEGEGIKRVALELAAISTVGLYILIPIRSFINCCFKYIEQDEKIRYNDVFLGFNHDYDRENPVTKREGFLKMLNGKL